MKGGDGKQLNQLSKEGLAKYIQAKEEKMPLEKQDLIKLYTNMVRGRKLDEIAIKGLMEGKLQGFFHSGIGSEAVGAGACTFLRKDDWYVMGHRGHGCTQVTSKGLDPKVWLAEHYGKATGCCQGWSGFHSADLNLGIPGLGGTIGSQFPLAVGLGIAAKTKGKGQVVVVNFGDGGSNRGTLHEAFNLAAIWNLPIVWICENNGMAIFIRAIDHYAGKDIADLAYGYGMPGVVVDGQDVVAVHEAVQAGVERARAGEGPCLVECKTYRFRPHCEGIPDLVGIEPRPAEELEEMHKKDPIKLFQEKLLAQGILTQADVDRIDKEADAEIAAAAKFAEESPPFDPEKMFKALYAD